MPRGRVGCFSWTELPWLQDVPCVFPPRETARTKREPLEGLRETKQKAGRTGGSVQTGKFIMKMKRKFQGYQGDTLIISCFKGCWKSQWIRSLASTFKLPFSLFPALTLVRTFWLQVTKTQHKLKTKMSVGPGVIIWFQLFSPLNSFLGSLLPCGGKRAFWQLQAYILASPAETTLLPQQFEWKRQDYLAAADFSHTPLSVTSRMRQTSGVHDRQAALKPRALGAFQRPEQVDASGNKIRMLSNQNTDVHHSHGNCHAFIWKCWPALFFFLTL